MLKILHGTIDVFFLECMFSFKLKSNKPLTNLRFNQHKILKQCTMLAVWFLLTFLKAVQKLVH